MKKLVMGMVLLGTVTTAEAIRKPPPPAPVPLKPPPVAVENAVLKAYAKAWRCTGSNAVGEKVTPKLTFKKELGEHWYSMKLDVPKTKLRPAYVGQGYVGFDSLSKGFALTGVDNMGGWVSLKGATADVTATSMTLAGEIAMDGQKAPAKFTFQIADRKLTFVSEVAGKVTFTTQCK